MINKLLNDIIGLIRGGTMKTAEKVIKKLVAFLLCFVMTFLTAGLLTCNRTQAAFDEDYITYNKELFDSSKELCDRLRVGMKNFQSEINIKDFKISISDKEYMRYIMKTVLRKNPELFYVDSTKYMLGSDGTYIAAICPIYVTDAQTAKFQINAFNEKCKQYTAKIDENMTDFQKAAIIHDELILNCKYLDEGETGHITAYDAIVKGEANCQGYACAYSYLLSLAGVYSEIVESSAMYHIWNKVCIDGSYYNVDLTWDDPMPNKTGLAAHRYFLLSDSAISSGDNDITAHYGFEYAYYKSSSTKYDNALYHSINTRLCFVGDNCYAIDNDYQSKYYKSLLKYDVKTDSVSVIKQFDFQWQAGHTSYWKSGYMSLDAYENLLYYNSPDSIFVYDIQSGEEKLFASIDTSKGECYGMLISDGVVYAGISESPNVESTIVNIGECIGTELYGDVNGDGAVTVTDATAVQKYCAGLISLSNEQLELADFNGDGRVNVTDATLIQKYIVSP